MNKLQEIESLKVDENNVMLRTLLNIVSSHTTLLDRDYDLLERTHNAIADDDKTIQRVKHFKYN